MAMSRTVKGPRKSPVATVPPKKKNPQRGAMKPTPGDCRSHDADPRKTILLKRLARVEGQVRGVVGMVEADRYCIDVLTQMAAVHEALRSAGREILENHMHTCVAEALASGNPKEADRVSAELGKLLERMSR